MLHANYELPGASASKLLWQRRHQLERIEPELAWHERYEEFYARSADVSINEGDMTDINRDIAATPEHVGAPTQLIARMIGRARLRLPPRERTSPVRYVGTTR